MSEPATTTGQPDAVDSAPTRHPPSSAVGAALVAAGILVSRVLGIVRNALMARYLGAGVANDAFVAAFRIPNMLQNLLGEGALSAAFIPVYSRLLAQGRREEATRVAGAVATLLGLITAALVLVGVLFAPALVDLIADGLRGERRALAIHFTRILFPGAALFVLGAWCLGVLNSHRRFFMGYVAPAAWNVAMIAALVWFGPRSVPAGLAERLAWASVVGALLQFAVQLPSVLPLVPGLRPGVSDGQGNVRTVMRNFAPVALSRGVVQISAFVDLKIASHLPTGMVSVIFLASQIYQLPVSLFGMSISAAELPDMSSILGDREEAARRLRERLDGALRRVAYFVVPSAAAFLALGDVIVGALLRGGRFGATETLFTWGVLAGSSVGLLAGTQARIYSSTYYALHDTRTPVLFATIRVVVGAAVALLLAFPAPKLLGLDPRWGAAGLTVASGMVAWLEFALLRSRLNERIGRTGVPRAYLARLWLAAGAAAGLALGAKLLLPSMHRIVVAVLVLGAFGAVYLGTTVAMELPEARALTGRVLRLVRRR